MSNQYGGGRNSYNNNNNNNGRFGGGGGGNFNRNRPFRHRPKQEVTHNKCIP